MLKFYITSIIIYAAIITATGFICRDAIKANGWLSEAKHTGNPLVILLCMSAIPILRVFFIFVALYMSVRTPEDLEKWRQELEEETVDFTSTFDDECENDTSDDDE